LRFGAAELDDLEPLERERALLADHLALARRQRGEEILEASITLVDPVELAVGPDQPSGLLEQRHLRLGDERGVRGGEAVRRDDALGRSDQGGGQNRLAGQQAAAGDRRERHGDLELGIIVAAGALIGVRPAVIEHIFAEAVALHISGQHRIGPSVRAVDGDRQRLPAGAGGGAARLLERREEGVAEERIVGAGAAVPILGREARHALRQSGDDRLLAHDERCPEKWGPVFGSGSAPTKDPFS
jgi:hypothetical protein